MRRLRFVVKTYFNVKARGIRRLYKDISQQFNVEAQKLEIKHDMKNIGLIKQDGKYYSIYDLPNGFVVRGDLNLSEMDLADVNLNIKVTGILNLAGAKNLKLHPKTDFSGTRVVDLSDTDLSGVREIKWPTKKVKLSWGANLPSVLDFSRTKEVMLTFSDLSGVREIKCPSVGINLSGCKNLPPVLDFSTTKVAILAYADLSGVREIKGSTEEIDLGRITAKLPPILDFSGTKIVILSYSDLSGVREIKWPDNGQILDPDKNRWPEHLRKSYDLWRAKMIVKNHSKETAKQNIPNRITSNGRQV